MEALLGMVGKFMPGLIFNDWPILQNDGFRGRQVVSPSIGSLLPNHAEDDSPPEAVLQLGPGLLGTYPGIKLVPIERNLP
jgi:hypothetical protein